MIKYLDNLTFEAYYIFIIDVKTLRFYILQSFLAFALIITVKRQMCEHPALLYFPVLQIIN